MGVFSGKEINVLPYIIPEFKSPAQGKQPF
jgi:hypothetical protein